MKILLSLLLVSTIPLNATVLLPKKDFAYSNHNLNQTSNNYSNLKTTLPEINYNFTDRVWADAGTRGLAWQTSDDTESKNSPTWTLDLSKYGFNNQSIINKMIFTFDLSNAWNGAPNASSNDASAVNINVNPPKFTYKASNITYNWQKWQLGNVPRSQNSGDYLEATFWINIAWQDQAQTILEWYFTYQAYAYNGGNGNFNTAGKGYANFGFKSLAVDTGYDLDNIKAKLTNKLSNQINLVSDYSGSLEDSRNINDPTGKGNDETTLLTNAIKNVIDNTWYAILKPTFSFSDSTRLATTTIKFNNPLKNMQQDVWTFTTPINITLSSAYWGKTLSQRLHLFPGQIVNPQDSTKGMITDQPDILDPPNPSQNYGGTLRYHTTANLEFDSSLDNSEWLEINGTKVDVLNNKFTATLADNRISGEQNNTYDIIAYHDDGTYKAQYEIKIVIETLIPDLKLKWYAWDPKNNPDQDILITPNLPDGKPNPKYDKEINPDTGTKTQIIWVKHKSSVSTPLDPLDSNGNIIDPSQNPEDYDLGFIAEGAVAGKGVNQKFNDPNITSVFRQGVQNSLQPYSSPTDRQKNVQIKSDGDTQYWSDSGIWHYVENLSDKTTAQKYMIIGADYSNKYPRFLDVLNNPNIAVDFWTTIHGVHLKNYLAQYKGLDSTGIGTLTYEQVAAYWKEYTSDVIAQRIPPDPTPANYVDITGNIPIVKMNETDLDKIQSLVVDSVNKYIKSKAPKAVINSDYSIFTPDGKDITIDNTGLASLLQDQTEPQYLNLKVVASKTSILLIGTATLTVRNSSSYDPTKVNDLSKINFQDYKYNFADFTPEQLRNWIIKDVDNYMQTYGYLDIVLNQDYGISGNGIPDEDPVTHHNTPGNLDDLLLSDFLDNSTGIKTITLIIYADNASDKTTGYAYQTLINDPNATPVPPDPPIPPDPNPQPDNNFTKQNLWWIITLVVGLSVIGIVTVSIVLIRRKKGLGKKNVKRKGAKTVK